MASTQSAPRATVPATTIDAGVISARLDRLPPTRSVWKLVALLSLGFFFELYDLLYSGYVAPGLVKGGILSATTRGLFGTTGVASFIAALFAGLFIGTIACGFLADRFGRRAVFTWSLLWYTAANVVMAFQDTAGGLNFWRFVVGLGLGVEMVTIGTYLSELVPKQIRGRAFACEQAVGFVAVPVVALLAYLLVPHAPFGLDGWRWVVLIGAHGAIFVWWIRRQLPESPRWLAQQGRLDEAERVLAALEARGVERATLTLHVGAGTFQPVRVENLAEHRMHSESYELTDALVEKIAATRARGGRVIAVGTTSMRALEAAARDAQAASRPLAATRAETDIFITPGYRFRVVDRLVTNFHLPKSTLLMLVSAFAGIETIRAAYRHAIDARYRFFSYGDAMLLTRRDDAAEATHGGA